MLTYLYKSKSSQFNTRSCDFFRKCSEKWRFSMIFFILLSTFWPDSFYRRLCRDINQGDGLPHWTLGTLTPTLSPLFLYEFWILDPASKQTALVHWLHVGCQFSRLHPQWYHNLSEKLLHRESLWRQLVGKSKVYVLSYEGHCWQCFAPHPGKLTNPFLLLASAI